MKYLLLLISFLLFSSNKDPQTKLAKEDQIIRIAVLPDTQYYTAIKYGGTLSMFEQQIQWIKANREQQHIAYVAHLGDISDHGEEYLDEWERARNVLYQLETPVKGLPSGIPYGVAVGNHDTTPNGAPGKLPTGFIASFGRSHFEGKPYYGDSFNHEASNANHYDIFTAYGQKFLVLYIAYNEPGNKYYQASLADEVLQWAGNVLKTHADCKAIVVSHSILKNPAKSNSNLIPNEGNNSPQSAFTAQGKATYASLKTYPNVFMMLCGHRSGEGQRIMHVNGNTVKIFLSDYQSRRNAPFGENDRNGGNGLMRLIELNLTKQTLHVQTFAPQADGSMVYEKDSDSDFTLPLYQ